MSAIELAASNRSSPPILCFALGATAVMRRSNMKLPEQVFTALSMYLMLAIGIKGGAELAGRPMAELAAPIAAALVLGCAIPLWSFALLRRYAGLSIPDAAAMAAHYGSVSAVTFAAATALLDRQGIVYEGYAAALLAIMEIPAIVIGIGLAGVASLAGSVAMNRDGTASLSSSGSAFGARFGNALADVVSSKSVLLLAGGLVIGAAAGPVGLAKVKPFFVDLFTGMLCLFLLELGRAAAERAPEFKKVGARLATFAIAMPLLHGAIGILAAHAAGLSMGGAIVLGTLAASASYIAAPAAVRLALPEANPGYYLTCSIAITFPFNITVGLPLYAAMAKWLYA